MRLRLPILARIYPHGEFREKVLLDMTREGWFIRLRWLIVAALLVYVGVERVLSPRGRPAAIPLTLAILGLLNFAWRAIGQRILRTAEGGETPRVFWQLVALTNAQMVIDLAALTVLLRFTGAASNPMSIFYLFHVLIAALLLRPLNALLQGLWGLILFSTVVVGEQYGVFVPRFSLLATPIEATAGPSADTVVLAILILAAGIFGSLYFALQISWRLDAQEQRLLEANRALLASEAAIKQLQDKRSRFMQTAAHQLKAPVAAIETLANLIRDDVVPPGQVKSVIARIRARCGAAIEQVSELITLERIEQSSCERHLNARTPFAQIAHRVGSRFAVQARAKGIDYHEELSRVVGIAVAVEERDLDDCMTNLVDNAIKYTPNGGSVWLGATYDNNKLRVTIRDTGMGIAADQMEHLFDPFRRGNEALAANIAGTGLGLTIVHEVLERARGAIDVQSEKGMGSTFTVWLPVASTQEAGKPASTVRSSEVTNHARSGYVATGPPGHRG